MLLAVNLVAGYFVLRPIGGSPEELKSQYDDLRSQLRQRKMVLDRTRLLSDVASALSDNHVNILSATSSTGRDRIVRLRFTFELADIAHLSSLLQSVKGVDGVFDAYRIVPTG